MHFMNFEFYEFYWKQQKGNICDHDHKYYLFAVSNKIQMNYSYNIYYKHHMVIS